MTAPSAPAWKVEEVIQRLLEDIHHSPLNSRQREDIRALLALVPQVIDARLFDAQVALLEIAGLETENGTSARRLILATDIARNAAIKISALKPLAAAPQPPPADAGWRPDDRGAVSKPLNEPAPELNINEYDRRIDARGALSTLLRAAGPVDEHTGFCSIRVTPEFLKHVEKVRDAL